MFTRAASIVLLALLLNIISPHLKSTFRPIYDALIDLSVPVVKLYGSPMSTCTRRVATVLVEKGIPYELVPIDLGKGEQKEAHYVQKLQPFGQVPVLQDGEFIVYESRAIARYLATKYAHLGSPLLPNPDDFEAIAAFEQAASVEQNNFDPFASGIASERVFKPRRGGNTDVVRVKELEDGLDKKLDGYEIILSRQRYLAGDSITLADLFHLPYGSMITEQLGVKSLTSPSRPNVTRWWKDISSRSSWAKVKNGA